MMDWKQYLQNEWKKYIEGRSEGHPIDEQDLIKIGIWDRRKPLRKELYLDSYRADCILIQGGAFVIDGLAYLLLGMSTIDILETMSQHKEVDGIIGTGNSLYLSRDFQKVYSTLSKDETKKRYEIEKTGHSLKYLEEAKIGPLIIINRTFRDKIEFDSTKKGKKDSIEVDIGSNFYTKPVRYAGSIKTRLRWKFIKTARTCHCVTNPTLTEKELIFDEESNVRLVIDRFKGHFILGYMLWSEKFANSVGMVSNYSLRLKDNPSEIIGYALIKYMKQNMQTYFKIYQ